MGIAELSGSNSVVKGVKGNAETDYRTGLVNLTPANVGAVAKSGDTMTGTLTSTSATHPQFLATNGTANTDVGYRATRSDTSVSVRLLVGSGGTNHGVYSDKLGKWIIHADSSTVYVNGLNVKDAATARSSIGCMYAVSANGYYGMGRPDGNTSDWIRTTSSGLIPYASGGSGSLGTSSWPFNNAYIKNIYVGTTALKTAVLGYCYPVGTYVWCTSTSSPASAYGFPGTWVRQYFEIISENSGMALDVDGAATTAANVSQYTINYHKNQSWYFISRQVNTTTNTGRTTMCLWRRSA